MKIIREGNISNKTIRFNCPACNCIFEASSKEYIIGCKEDRAFVRINCPCCKCFIAKDLGTTSDAY